MHQLENLYTNKPHNLIYIIRHNPDYLVHSRIFGRLRSSVLASHEALHLPTTLPSSLTTGTAAATRTGVFKHYLVISSFSYILFSFIIDLF